MRNRNSTIILFLLLFSACNYENNDKKGEIVNVHESGGDKELIHHREIDSVVNLPDLKVLFDRENELIVIADGKEKYEIGRYSNTLGEPPEVQIKQLSIDVVGVLVITNNIQLGESTDALVLFGFNKKNKDVYKLCEFVDFPVHGMETDTLQGIKYFDFDVQVENKKIVVTEYHPYKSVETTKQPLGFYSKIKECKYTLK